MGLVLCGTRSDYSRDGYHHVFLSGGRPHSCGYPTSSASLGELCVCMYVCMYVYVCMWGLVVKGLGLMIHGLWVRVPPLADER